MDKILKLGFPMSVFLIFLFLLSVPPSAFHAEQAANQGSSPEYTEHWFGDGATVESVREGFSNFDSGTTVSVTDQDGASRTSGPLAEGDIVEVYDCSGKLFLTFVNVKPEDVSEASSGKSDKDSSVGESQSSSTPQQTGSSSIQEGPVYSGDGGYYRFDGPVPVAELEDLLSKQGVAGSVLTVRTASGSIRQSGAVCTGDTLTVENPDGTLQSRVTAVIPGDLTRCGSPDAAACKMLYNYLTGSGTLKSDLRRAADLNGDGSITTSDLLQLKKLISGDG